MKKKILYIITYLELGGAQKQLLYTSQHLNRNKYSIFLYSGNSGKMKNNFLKLNITGIYFDKHLTRRINILNDLIVFFKMFLYIKKHKFDIVHLHSPKAGFLGRWAAFFAGAKKIIYTVHGWPFYNRNFFLATIGLLAEKISYCITDIIIVVSSYDYQQGVKKIGSSKKIKLIHYGIDIEKYQRIYFKRKNFFKKDKVILNISAAKLQKGINDFINIAFDLHKLYPSWQWQWLGNGPYYQYYCQKVKNKNMQTYFKTIGWRNQISHFLENSQLLVLTSYWEGLPLVVLEAVISGVPIVASDTGGVKDIIIEGENGLLFPPGNIKMAKEAIVEVMENSQKWEKKIYNYREKLDFSYWKIERMINNTVQLY